MIAALPASPDEEWKHDEGNLLRGSIGKRDFNTGADWSSSFRHKLG